MHSRTLFCFTSIFSVVSALGPDSSWFLDEDLSSNTDFSSSPEYLSAALPSDLDFSTALTTPSMDPYSTDISSNNDLLWNTDLDSGSNLFTLDSPLVVADCSSSESFPIIGKKSRLRRANQPNSCTNDGTVNSGVSNGLDLPIKLFSPDGLDELDRAITGPDKEQNSECVKITQGILPVGVCSTGRLEDTVVAGALTIAGIQFASLTFRNAVLCTFSPRVFDFHPLLLVRLKISVCFFSFDSPHFTSRSI